MTDRTNFKPDHIGVEATLNDYHEIKLTVLAAALGVPKYVALNDAVNALEDLIASGTYAGINRGEDVPVMISVGTP